MYGTVKKQIYVKLSKKLRKTILTFPLKQISISLRLDKENINFDIGKIISILRL